MGGHIGKKHAAAGVLAVIAVLLAVWLFTRPEPLAEIHRSFSSPETGSADVSFPVEAGKSIRVRISTRTESGVMEVTLLDEAGAVVYSFGSATYQERHLTLAESGMYTLEVQFRDFTGDGDAAVYPSIISFSTR
jgi:hypothetical protein